MTKTNVPANAKITPSFIVVVVAVAAIAFIGITALLAIVLMVTWAGFATPVLGFPLLDFGEAMSGIFLLFLVGLCLGTWPQRRRI